MTASFCGPRRDLRACNPLPFPLRGPPRLRLPRRAAARASLRRPPLPRDATDGLPGRMAEEHEINAFFIANMHFSIRKTNSNILQNLPSLGGLVLGCIELDFLRVDIHFVALLFKIYRIGIGPNIETLVNIPITYIFSANIE